MYFSPVETLLILLLTALVVSAVFQACRLPMVLGYLVVGTFVGPNLLGWLSNTSDIKELAEFGVALLMFTIGLEFSVTKLLALRRAVFILGSLQVLVSIGATVGIGLLLKMSLTESIVLGCVVAMSSTAIVIKQLSEQREVQSKYGLNAVGILLFQDLAVIPILVLVASLADSSQSYGVTISLALLKGCLAVLAIVALGRWVLRPLFHIIAATRVSELFTFSALFIAIGSAWLTHMLGVSYALGAFLAGIMLGETEFRHQIKLEIRPFRDVLLGLFFVSIGMLVNIYTWVETWPWILLLLIAIMGGKAILIVLLCRLTNNDLASSLKTGLILSQGGEFGFAVLTLALSDNLIPADYGQVVIAALLISFALAAFVIRYNDYIANLLFPRAVNDDHEKTKSEIKAISKKLSQHVIICGYGRVGQNIAALLNKVNYSYIGLDINPGIIRKAVLAGDSVAFGNTCYEEILEAANISQAKAVVVSFDDLPFAIATVKQIRRRYKELPVIVRCKDASEFAELQHSGATEVVAEIFEESLSLVHQLLDIVEIPHQKIAHLLQGVRDENYEILQIKETT